MAPPFKHINWDEVKFFIKAGTTQRDIANSLGIDEDTLRNRVKLEFGMDYSVFSAQQYSEGNKLLFGKQFDKAIKGNVPMLLHLGKTRLGQKEAKDDTTIAPHQAQVDQTHTIMQQQNEIEELKKKLEEMSNANPQS